MYRRLNRQQKHDVKSQKLCDSDSDDDYGKLSNGYDGKQHTQETQTTSKRPASKIDNDTDSSTFLEELVLGGDSDVLKSLQVDSEKNTKKPKVLITDEKKPAWIDEDDESVDDKSRVNAVGETSAGRTKQRGKKRYINKLRSKFEKVTGTPNWATKRVDDVPTGDADSDAEDLLKSTGDSLVRSQTLVKGTIEMKRCTNANHDSPHGAKLKCLEFHRSAQVMLTAGMDYRLCLFQIDGKVNPLIQTTYFTKYPIHTAHFSSDGQEVIVGSIHANFYYYDMMVGKIVNVPRIKAIEESSMKHFEVSPDGKFLAFLGKSGFIHLISAKSKEWISSLKMNSTVSSVAFSTDGSKLYSHGDDAEVYVWDMATRDCIHRFYDDGCIHGTAVAVSPCDRYLACGSNTGVVNLYEAETCMSTAQPRPLKAVMNLTSTCTSLRFNATSEILGIASNEMGRAVKLVHTQSLSVFSNFPDRFTDRDIRVPLCLDFSPNSGFLSIGSNSGMAHLYRLKHYGNY